MSVTQDTQTQVPPTEGKRLGRAIQELVSWMDSVNDPQHPKPDTATLDKVNAFLRSAFEKEFPNFQASSVPQPTATNRPLKGKAKGKRTLNG